MKFRALFGGLLLAIASAAFAADELPITFNAVLSMGKEKRFGVASDGGARSAWLQIGQQFEGYTLQSFEDTTQTLILARDGQTFRLPIAGGSVQTLNTKATIADANEVMTKLRFEQMMGKLIDQQKKAMNAAAKQMLGPLGADIPQKDAEELQAKLTEALWSELKPEDLKQDMTKMYAELFTKDELRSMSDFYGTAAGQALIDKEPEMQQRMMNIIMPRMMAAVPRIQQIQQEFMQSHQKPAAKK
ncbi:MAG TPA: DUF2059 domain-containing protein [Opitutaceae bacterium]|nr:DUF2059 domain-containing protein [Opitutaceae bacterium]